jgi:hypothetical protein
MTRRCLWLCVVLCVFVQGADSIRALAGTTGALIGRVFDAKSGTPVVGARVSIASPSQNASAVTGPGGEFRFLSLAPDTYVLSVESAGFDPVSVAGVTITADQSQSVPVGLNKTLVTIGKVRSRNSSDLIRPGTTSDVYSVSGAAAGATQALGGPGSLTNAYGQIASVPGVVVQQGQQGWYQQLSIRGGDIDQVGYELDGIPVNRVYDNAPQTMLSTLGQQELQVYTGGTPATSDGQGLSGYVNQVIRTGTYPGFVDAKLGIAGPAYLHQASLEFGGANKNRTLTYYVGVAGANQDFRYYDQFQGASDPRFFYPIAYPFTTRFNIYDGSPNPLTGAPATVGNGIYFGPGNSYALATLSQRDTIANVHVAIPHKNDATRDDLQFLYVTSEIFNSYYSSVNDQGGQTLVGNALSVANGAPTSGAAHWQDGYVYNGAIFAPPNASQISPYYFMSSQQPRAFDAALPDSARDTNDNGVAILKVQYQKNFNAQSYLRAYGYSLYSNWFITGQANQDFTCCFGAELNDYEIPSHTYGANLTYSNQLDAKNLLTVTGSYAETKIQRRYYYGFPGDQGDGTPFTNLIDPATASATGHCYDPTSGGYADCFSGSERGSFDIPTLGGPAAADSGAIPVTATAFAGGAHPQVLVTENGALGRINNVSPITQAASLTDQFRPNDRTTLSLGVRIEDYIDRLADATGGPDGEFWVHAYDNEYCYKPGVFGAINVAANGVTPNAAGVFATPANCTASAGAGYLPADFSIAPGGNLSHTQVQPRVAFTYTVDPDTVVRASYGVYSRPVNTSWLQYNDLNSRDFTSYAATNFLGFGFHTQNHDLRPDTSYNYDLSLEKHLHGTDISGKVTPFYRSTRDQLQSFPLGVGGIVSGFNVGHQTSDGVELALRKGDFAKDGLSAQLSYTHTRSRIKYSQFPSGTNVIDTLNAYVQEYNSYTKGCAGTITRANASACGLAAGTVNPNAHGTFTTASGTVANPYYNAALQPLFDVNGEYTTYDQIPQPFVGENGYETPDVVALVTSFRHHGFSIAPSLTFSSGASYGSPISYPGYIPSGGCTPFAGTTNANPYTCGGASAVSGQSFLFIPDAFTGRFDGLGAFSEPSRLSLNLGLGYDLNKTVSFNVTLTGLVDRCFQRGYAWDDKNICVYSELPSGGAGLGPSGNFIPIASTPIQLRYPYGAFNNNLNTGFVGTTIPFEATATMNVKL